MTDITDKDRDFFEELANRPADSLVEEDRVYPLPMPGVSQTNPKLEAEEPKMPDWYRPHMKTRVGWLNGIPQRPLTKLDRRKGKWKDVPQY